jgi:tetratricopeptide (TPR) repeat protein
MSSQKTFLSAFLLIQLLVSCDFTPRLHKDIIRAQQYIHNQRYQDAIKTYHQILDENPRIDIRVKIYYQLGELHSTYLGKNKESLEYFEKIIAESNDPLWVVKSLEKIGEINFSYIRNYNESNRAYRKLNSFVPKLQNADFYEYRLASSLLMIGKIDEAIVAYENILLKPGHEYYVRSVYEMGNAYFQKKEWQTAVNYWLDYIKKETRRDNLVQAKFLIANAYETMEELQKAYNLYYSILGEYPNTEVIRSRLQSIYERRIARKR